jgi:type IV pilus assembly protein PilY1
MKMKIKLLGAACLIATAGMANAGAIISDGNVSLGVDDFGQLNISGGIADVTGITAVGMRYVDTGTGLEYESTSHGCLCEGWGVGIAETGEEGSSNNAQSTSGLSLDSFTSTATTATSVVSTASLSITHDFALASETDNLYRVIVEIENTSATDIVDLLYKRTFDWDTSPTPFDEFVTIAGSAASANIVSANDDGFCDQSVFSSCSEIVTGATGDFTALGPDDHGANFDFNFGELLAGESFTFEIFYGAAIGEAASLAALGEVGAEAFSFGWSAGDADQNGFMDSTGELAPTYIFGFSGVGGIALPDPTPDPDPDPDPTDVPEPAMLSLFGLGALMFFRARRKA